MNLFYNLLNHFKRWNIWRKKCINPWYHKLCVLLGISESPTMAYIVVRGNCPVCGKALKENESIFICDECYKKDLEYRKKGQN